VGVPFTLFSFTLFEKRELLALLSGVPPDQASADTDQMVLI